MREWVQEWIRSHDGYLSGAEWVMTCPFCGKPQHMYISDRTGAWICFHCGEASWKLRTLLQRTEGSGWMRLGMALGVESSDPASRPAQDQPKANRVFTPLPKECEPLLRGNRWYVPKYLKDRRVNKHIAHRLGVCYCLTGEYANRIILPISCPMGESFTSRAVLPGLEPRYKAGEGAGRLLYAWQSLGWHKGTVVLVEGPFDAIRVIQAGFSAIALMGKILSMGKRILLNSIDRPLVVMLDQEARDESISIARELGARVASSVDDPADMVEQQVVEAISETVDADTFRVKALLSSHRRHKIRMRK